MKCWLIAAGMALTMTHSANADPFVRVQGLQFTLNGARFPVVGVNNHYLPWGSAGEVRRVLDAAAAVGATVVRTFLSPVIGSLDGSTPTIWKPEAGDTSNDLNTHGMFLLSWDPKLKAMLINTGPTGLQHIDFLIAEAAKRHLKLILAFGDFWRYTGGAPQISRWYGVDPVHSGPAESRDPSFFSDPHQIADYQNWIKAVIERRNTFTDTVYRDDPTILAWELMNEPHAPKKLLNGWTNQMAHYVKALDSNHLVASGGAQLNRAEFAMKDIDFLTWHGYPLYEGISVNQFSTEINFNCTLGELNNKPVVLEEFGYARSNTTPSQAQTYMQWLKTIDGNPSCGGWLVWRLVATQDNGTYPPDKSDQFDIHQDGGATWQVLSAAAHAH